MPKKMSVKTKRTSRARIGKKAAAKAVATSTGIIPALSIRGAAAAIDFYKKAFGAEVVGDVFLMPDGKVGHAELKIEGSPFMVSDEFPSWGSHAPATLKGTTVSVWVYVKDVDALFNRAVQAGAEVRMPLADQFWGDRTGEVRDPFGHRWALATHKEDVTQEEIKKRAAAFFEKNKQAQPEEER
jgi:PhnB protein